MNKILTALILFFYSFAHSQTCFEIVSNAIALNLSFAEQSLETRACSLENHVNTIFELQNNDFQVLSYHNYLPLSTLSDSLKTEQFNLIMNRINSSSTYYLAIITEGEKSDLLKNVHVRIKLPTHTSIPCLNATVIGQIEEKVRQAIIYKYDKDDISTIEAALVNGMDKLSTALTSLSQNNCCTLSAYEIIAMFKQNGFEGFPINLDTAVVTAPSARFNSTVLHDFANLTFSFGGREIDFGALNIDAMATDAVIVTKNENLCENSGYTYQEAANLYASSSNVYWYHIWISPDSTNSDFLLVKSKPYGGYVETVPPTVAYLKRTEKEVIEYKPIDEDYAIPPARIEFEHKVYAFMPSAALLLSKVAKLNVPNAYEEIILVEIRNNQGGILPAYDPHDGGGGMTFPWFKDKNQVVIQYTANYFSTTGFGNENFGNSPMAWLDISAHEVGHIKHVRECNCPTAIYMSSFAWEYYVSMGHNSAPRELEADIGQAIFRTFRNWVFTSSPISSVLSLGSLFSSQLGDTERGILIEQLWNLYPDHH